MFVLLRNFAICERSSEKLVIKQATDQFCLSLGKANYFVAILAMLAFTRNCESSQRDVLRSRRSYDE